MPTKITTNPFQLGYTKDIIMSLKLLSLNIEGHKHLDKIIPFLKQEQPDIVCLQEVFKSDLPRPKQALHSDHSSPCATSATCSTCTTPVHVVFAPMVIIDGPNRVDFPFLGELGIAILSKLPLKDSSLSYYVGSPNLIPHVTMDPNHTNRVVLATTFEGETFKGMVATTHFTWAPDGATTLEQDYDLQKLFAGTARMAAHILTGDFNIPRGNKMWEQLTQKYTDHIPPTITTTLDPSLHRAGPLEWVVDGLFSTPKDYNINNVHIIPGLSDHQAISATIA